MGREWDEKMALSETKTSSENVCVFVACGRIR